MSGINNTDHSFARMPEERDEAMYPPYGHNSPPAHHVANSAGAMPQQMMQTWLDNADQQHAESQSYRSLEAAPFDSEACDNMSPDERESPPPLVYLRSPTVGGIDDNTLASHPQGCASPFPCGAQPQTSSSAGDGCYCTSTELPCTMECPCPDTAQRNVFPDDDANGTNTGHDDTPTPQKQDEALLYLLDDCESLPGPDVANTIQALSRPSSGALSMMDDESRESSMDGCCFRQSYDTPHKEGGRAQSLTNPQNVSSMTASVQHLQHPERMQHNPPHDHRTPSSHTLMPKTDAATRHLEYPEDGAGRRWQDRAKSAPPDTRAFSSKRKSAGTLDGKGTPPAKQTSGGASPLTNDGTPQCLEALRDARDAGSFRPVHDVGYGCGRSPVNIYPASRPASRDEGAAGLEGLGHFSSPLYTPASQGQMADTAPQERREADVGARPAQYVVASSDDVEGRPARVALTMSVAGAAFTPVGSQMATTFGGRPASLTAAAAGSGQEVAAAAAILQEQLNTAVILQEQEDAAAAAFLQEQLDAAAILQEHLDAAAILQEQRDAAAAAAAAVDAILQEQRDAAAVLQERWDAAVILAEQEAAAAAADVILPEQRADADPWVPIAEGNGLCSEDYFAPVLRQRKKMLTAAGMGVYPKVWGVFNTKVRRMRVGEKSPVATRVKIDAGTSETHVIVSIGAKPKYSGNKGNISYRRTVVIELRSVPERSLAQLLSEATGRAKVSLYNVMGTTPGDVTVFQLRLVLDMPALYQACRVQAHTPLVLDFTISSLPPAANGSFICATVKIPKSQNRPAMGARCHSAERKSLTAKAPESQMELKTTPTCAAERKAHNEAVRKNLLDSLCNDYPNRMDVVRLGGVNVAV